MHEGDEMIGAKNGPAYLKVFLKDSEPILFHDWDIANENNKMLSHALSEKYHWVCLKDDNNLGSIHLNTSEIKCFHYWSA
jgi:hypothetical protein